MTGYYDVEPFRKELGSDRFSSIAEEMRKFAIGYMFDVMRCCWECGISLPLQTRQNGSFLEDSREGLLRMLNCPEDCLTQSYCDVRRNPYLRGTRGAYFLNKEAFEISILKRFSACYDLPYSKIVQVPELSECLRRWKDKLYQDTLVDPLVIRHFNEHRQAEIERLAEEEAMELTGTNWSKEGF